MTMELHQVFQVAPSLTPKGYERWSKVVLFSNSSGGEEDLVNVTSCSEVSTSLMPYHTSILILSILCACVVVAFAEWERWKQVRLLKFSKGPYIFYNFEMHMKLPLLISSNGEDTTFIDPGQRRGIISIADLFDGYKSLNDTNPRQVQQLDNARVRVLNQLFVKSVLFWGLVNLVSVSLLASFFYIPGNGSLLGYASAISPPVVLSFYFVRTYRYSLSWMEILFSVAWILMLTFVWTLIISYGVLELEEVLEWPEAGLCIARFADPALTSYFWAGWVEELLKLMAILLAGHFSFQPIDPRSYLIRGAFAGIGFAGLENILYVSTTSGGTLGFSVAVLRAFSAVPGHVLTGLVVGIGLAERKFYTLQYSLGWLNILALPCFIHGTYDLILFFGAVLQEELGSEFYSVGAFFLAISVGIVSWLMLIVSRIRRLEKTFPPIHFKLMLNELQAHREGRTEDELSAQNNKGNENALAVVVDDGENGA